MGSWNAVFFKAVFFPGGVFGNDSFLMEVGSENVPNTHQVVYKRRQTPKQQLGDGSSCIPEMWVLFKQ